MRTVNAMGEVCPIPIVMTKNAIKEMTEAGTLEILVDNETSVQNLMKMASQKGYPAKAEQLGEARYHVLMEISAEVLSQKAEAAQEADGAELCPTDEAAPKGGNTVVVFSSDKMGTGAEELGGILVKAFTFALTQMDELPRTMIFYNGGVKLTCEGSPLLEDLKTLEAEGVEIISCGTCLGYYELKEKLAVGSISNMYDIVEKQMKADRIIKP